jgi:hypothetical protein
MEFTDWRIIQRILDAADAFGTGCLFYVTTVVCYFGRACGWMDEWATLTRWYGGDEVANVVVR